MIIRTFYHQLDSGENVKFTIQDTYISGIRYFCANLINVDLDFYKEMSPEEKSSYLGMFITDGNQNRIYYSDPDQLESDIKDNYGKIWLKSEF